MSVLVSVIIPTYNEAKYIALCLDSIIANDFPKDEMEVLIVDGMSTDKTQEIVREYSQKHSFIRLINNEKKVVPYALNKGLKASIGEFIVRMDAHSFYPDNYISQLLHYHKKLKADNVGGAIQILPANDSVMARAIAYASGASFGVGNSRYRIETNKITIVDTVPFGCFRRDLFDEIGFFDTELIRNQDDEFNARLTQNGGKIYLIPDIKIQYYARPNLHLISKMFYQYALYKPLVNKKLKHPSSLRQFVPLAFVFYLLLMLIAVAINFYVIYVILPLIAYLLLSIAFSLKTANKKKDYLSVLVLPIIFFAIHLSYGIGYIAGLAKYRVFS